MNQDLQLKLQAYLDGELPSGEAKGVADLVAQQADLRALLAELTHTRSVLAGFESEIKLPETREFYWSKIARDIQRQERSVPERSSASIFTFLRRLAVPSGVLVALLMGVLVVKQQLGFDRQFGVVETDTDQIDAGTFTYRDFASGTTLVWLSYPAENEFAESGRRYNQLGMKPTFMAALRFGSLALVLSLLALGSGRIQAADASFEAQLIWATNDKSSPNPKHKEAEAETRRRLRKLPLKWANYFEVNRKSFTVSDNGTNRVVMSEKSSIEVKRLDAQKVEVLLYGKKGDVCTKQTQPLPKGEILVFGGESPNATAWLVTLKRTN